MKFLSQFGTGPDQKHGERALPAGEAPLRAPAAGLPAGGSSRGGERRRPPPVQHPPLRAAGSRREGGTDGRTRGGGMAPGEVSNLTRKRRSVKPAVLRGGCAGGAGGAAPPAAWMLRGARYPGALGRGWLLGVSPARCSDGRHAFLVSKLPLERSFVGSVACAQSPGGRQDAVCWVARSLTLQSKVNNRENNKFQLQTPVICWQQPL